MLDPFVDLLADSCLLAPFFVALPLLLLDVGAVRGGDICISDEITGFLLSVDLGVTTLDASINGILHNSAPEAIGVGSADVSGLSRVSAISVIFTELDFGVKRAVIVGLLCEAVT